MIRNFFFPYIPRPGGKHIPGPDGPVEVRRAGRLEKLFASCPFRCFQRIDFNGAHGKFWFDMGCKITDPKAPFGIGGGVGLAEFIIVGVNYSVAAVAFFVNRVKQSTAVHIFVNGGGISHDCSP